MPLYKVRALDNNDNVVENIIKADNEADAKSISLDKGLTVIKIEETMNVQDIGAGIDIFNKIKLQEIIVFCRQMAIIIKSGISLTMGLDILKKQSTLGFKKTIMQVNAEVQKGRTLAQAMKETDLKFPDLLVRMISTGESSGNMDAVLDNMGDYYERENYLKQKLTSAMVYPIILIVMAIGMLIFFSYFILPSMNELMEGQELPIITQVVMGIIDGLTSIYSLIVIVIIILLLIVIKRVVPINKYRKVKDTIILKVPVIGEVIKDIITVRFLTTLHLLTKSGMDIVNVLEIIKKIMSNYLAEEALEQSLEGIKRGERLGETLLNADFFEPLAVQMISVGEETGELEKILAEVSSFYEKRLELKIEKLVSLIEPAFTLIIGGSIGVIILAIALPIFTMTGNLDMNVGGVE